MELLDILVLGVEASIALAGFAGIIATFQFRSADETRRGDAVGLTIILQFSLFAALSCSVAIVLHSFDFKEATTWAICSALSVVLQAWGLRGVIQTMRGVEMTKSFRRLAVVLQIPTLIMMLMNIMNALDIYFHREAGPVIATAVYALSIAAFMFSRLLLIPVWRNVRRQEAAMLAAATSG